MRLKKLRIFNSECRKFNKKLESIIKENIYPKLRLFVLGFTLPYPTSPIVLSAYLNREEDGLKFLYPWVAGFVVATYMHYISLTRILSNNYGLKFTLGLEHLISNIIGGIWVYYEILVRAKAKGKV